MLTSALLGTLLAIDTTFTDIFTVCPLITRSAVALACSAVTHAAVHTQAWLQTGGAIEAQSTRLITVEPGPSWLARALAFHRMAAECVCVLTET